MGISFVSQGLQLHGELNLAAPVAAARQVTEQTPGSANSALLFAPPVITQQTAATPLHLTLLACFVQADASRSVALIALDRQRPRRLMLGDEVAPGLRLRQVESNRVVLAQNGQTLTLGLRRAKAAP